MRILYVSAALPPTEVPEADLALRQCLHLAEAGHDVHVLTTEAHGDVELPGVTVHPIARTWGWSDAPRIWRLLRAVRPDGLLIYFLGTLYNYKAFPTVLPILGRLVGATPVTEFSNLGSGGDESAKLRRLVFRLLGPFRYGALLPVSRRLVVLSDLHRRRLGEISRRAADKAVIVPAPSLLHEASDPREARRRRRAELGLDDGVPLVAFIGRLYPGKGIEELVAALSEIRATHPQAKLVLIGGALSPEHYWITHGDYGAHIDDVIAAAGVRDAVVRTGEFDWHDPRPSEFLYAADVCVLPLEAGVYLYNSSLAAAASHGLPLVVSQGQVPEEALVHGDNAYILDDRAPGTIADAVVDVLGDPELSARLRRGAAGLAETWFSWESAVAKLEDALAGGSA